MHVLEALGTAQAATRAAGQIAAPFFEPEFARTGDVHLHFDAERRLLDLNVVQLRRIGQQPFGETESECEIIEVSRRGQHHRMRDAVEYKRHRHLVRQPVIRALGATRTMRRNRCLAGTGGAQLGVVRFQLPATLVAHDLSGFLPALRQQVQLVVLNSEYSRCQLEGCATGITCTAVTLYSGQLVAQSEFSVVMTLAPDSGKWKVV